MREIKFRAWDGNKMIDGSDLIFSEDGIFIWTDVDYNEEFKGEVMQYTGLKDKNGVEIYEGDVVYGRYTYRGKNTGQAVVEWSNSGFYARLRLLSEWYTLEVIGNIYENPELLESEL